MLGGRREVPAGPASPPPGFAETTAAAAGRLRWWLAARLDRLALTPTSLLGVCLALGITASGWFTGGTRSADVNGAIALCCGYLAALGARRLTGGPPGSQAARAAASSGRRAISAGGLAAGERQADDWRAMRAVGATGVTAGGRQADAWPAQAGAAGSTAVRRAAGRDRAGWLAALATRLFDSVVYVGLAVGAVALGWGDQIWPLALSVLALVAVRETMLACTGGALRGDAEQGGIARRVIMTVATMPLGGRVLLIAVAAPIWGPRAALLGLLDWGIIAVGLGLGSANPARRRDKAEPADD
jgi:preprotein translocase subunit Sec61beta